MRWLVLVLAVVQILTGWLPSGIGIGQTVAARSIPLTTPATPAGYAFAIWGLIYLWCLVYAIWQALPARRGDAMVEEARGPAALLFAANAAWSFYVQLADIDAVSVAIIVAGVAGGLAAMARLKQFAPRLGSPRLGSTQTWLVKAPLGLTAGWVSVAAFANVAAITAANGLVPVQLGEAGMAVVLVAAAGLLAATVTRSLRTGLAYPAAAIWGLAAIAVANHGQAFRGMVEIAAVAAAALVAIAAFLPQRKLTRP